MWPVEQLCGEQLCGRVRGAVVWPRGTVVWPWGTVVWPWGGGKEPELCGDFKRGKCDRGDQCKYSHGDSADGGYRKQKDASELEMEIHL